MTENKLICPFCNKKLDYDDLLCSCINEYCEESFDMVGTEMIWQKVIDLQYDLIDTKKKLDVAVGALKEIRKCHNYTTDEAFVAYEALYKLGEIEQINEITKGGK